VISESSHKVSGIFRAHFTSNLFQKVSADTIRTASNHLLQNGLLFLFGTQELELDSIYCNNLLLDVTRELNANHALTVFNIPLSESIEKSLLRHDGVDMASLAKKTSPEGNRLALSFGGCSAFFQGLSSAEISTELSHIDQLVSNGILCLFYFNQLEITHNLASLAPLLNRSSQFIPHAGWEGVLYFVEEECASRKMILSPACRAVISETLQETNMPLPLVAECIHQVDLLLTEKSSKERVVLPEHYEQVGGFSMVLQVQGDRLVSQLSANIDALKLKRFFQCFLKQDEHGLFCSISLSAEEISARTNFPKKQVSDILQVAELPEYQFFRQKNGRYELASRVMLTHWEEMKQWVLEEQEHINMYLRTKKQAVLYSNGEAELLTGINLDAALLWLEQADPTLAWATPYAPEYELTLAYIEASSKQRQAYLVAKQRRSKQLLKITRGIAFVVGVAFIISSLAAVFAGVERNKAIDAKTTAETERLIAVEARVLADQERQKALLARNAEQEAKVRAESQRKEALWAKEIADQERLKAVSARNAEQMAKEAAVRDRAIAISAKDQAEFERKNAISARSEEQKALVRANENFKNAEKLRIQQESRANALSAFQYYNNNQAIIGLKLARTAYTTNLANGGSMYEHDILKSLIYGVNAQQPEQYTQQLNHPLRNIAVSPIGGLTATCSIGGLITIFQNSFEKISEIKISGQKFQSMCFSGTGQLLVGTTTGELLTFNAKTGELIFKRLVSDQPIRCITLLDPERQIIALVSGHEIVLFNGLAETSEMTKKTVSTKEVPSEMIYSVSSSHLFFSLGRSVFSILVRSGHLEETPKSICTMNQFVTSIAVATFQGKEYLMTGDLKGNGNLIDASNGEIKFTRKIHLSSVSGCHLESINDHLLIVTSGYDQRVNVYYVIPDSAGKFEQESTIDFNFHHGWVTDMAVQPINGTLLTCSKDMTLRIWQFKPQDIFSRVEKILQNEN
jgi:WD40 repeat protein